jgi:geranylgeranyl pyrophosphate synthase
MLGVFFQMLDDVVDLYGEKGRQEAGCDIREGKMSALIVAHLERFPADAAWLLSVLRTPRGETTSEQVETVRVRLRESGTMAETLRRAMELLAGIRGSDTVRRYPALRPVIEATAARSLGTVSHLLSTESNTQMEQRNAS